MPQPTSPLRNSKDIDKSIEHIIDKNFSSLISISASKKKFNVETKKSLKFNLTSKSKEKIFLFKWSNLFDKKKFYLNFSKPFIWQKKNKCTYIKIPTSRSIDIDTMEDLLEFKKIIRKNEI